VRHDGRQPDQLREVSIITGVQEFAEGSVVIETGRTRVMCAVSVESGVPSFLRGLGQGWITAEYSMLPRSTLTRTPRETRGSRGRTQEIQRLIGRSLRAAVDLERLGERTLTVDCDVLQADGGTRTAAITGAYVALHLAIDGLVRGRELKEMPVKHAVASTSVGLVEGRPLLDLSYEEDFRAETDFNVVMTADKEFVEVQGTAERGAFSRETLNDMLALAESGISCLLQSQAEAIGVC